MPRALNFVLARDTQVFGYLRIGAEGNRKGFKKGIAQLLAEGAVQCLKGRGDGEGADPLLAAVGELQFEVVQDRLLGEYNVPTTLERVSYDIARWAYPDEAADTAWAKVDTARNAGHLPNVFQAQDVYGRPVLLFRSRFAVERLEADPDIDLGLSPWATAPTLTR